MPLSKKIIWLTLFSIAMGFMETAVVVYLRKVYYPDGFAFPLVPIEPNIALTEFLREAATIIMLVGIGILAGKNAAQKFSFFIYCFAIWDLFYYIFLKLLLDWPESWFTWDVLFLIPVPWVGPVLAPCIVSLTMIALAGCIVYLQYKGCEIKIKWREWLLLLGGCFIVMVSFMTDYFAYLNEHHFQQIWTLMSKEQMFIEIAAYIPNSYNWSMFWLGEILMILGILLFNRRSKFSGVLNVPERQFE